MRFTLRELLNAGSHKWKESEVDTVTLRNLDDLVRKLNALGYEPPMRATSCLRSLADQKRINPSAMGSSHLYGCAVDIADPNGFLADWLECNPNKLVECGLWMEDPKSTHGKNGNWTHLQSYAPRSMNRIFKP